MLRIYPLSLQMIREVGPYAKKIARFDRDLSRQLLRSSSSVALNMSEGSGSRGGNRRSRYDISLGSAKETRTNLEVAEALNYIGSIDVALLDHLDHIIATLWKLVR